MHFLKTNLRENFSVDGMSCGWIFVHTLPINILLGSIFLVPQMQFPNGYFCTVLQLALSQPGQAIKLRPTKTGPPPPPLPLFFCTLQNIAGSL